MIENFYHAVLKFLNEENIAYKQLHDGLDFTTSDIDIILHNTNDLKKIKNFILNQKIKKIIKINKKLHFYFLVMDDENIHAFDFMVGLTSSHGLICPANFLFAQETEKAFLSNYKLLKNASKQKKSFYVVKEYKKSPFSAGKLFFKKITNYIKNGLCRGSSGVYLVLLGSDGSGKSTASEYIKSSFSSDRKLFTYKEIYFKPNVFKIKPDVYIPAGESRPHTHKTYSSFLSVMKVIYVFLNYLLYTPVLYLRKKNGHLIVFDRHFYDILVDQQRYRLNQHGFLAAKILSRFILKPDLVIALSADKETLMKRKPNEVAEDILIEINKKYEQFSMKNVNVLHIKNDGTLESFKKTLYSSLLKNINNVT
ncbi:thymidylate kinase (plasmid) [Legionella adelaidensis]|uniref:Thymidylate kinase n=1 Tax=Legionella adelaidensis TaxID=45056 RepID=A0A0W0R4X0_9GAMM|nr:hypothetical protein [Legionella adelaidensis]KTC66078.1 thymidylate kinase [Legionella adelaidensis]VEH85704.1 thymidylate kinase [Legionella adelaidensis]